MARGGGGEVRVRVGQVGAGGGGGWRRCPEADNRWKHSGWVREVGWGEGRWGQSKVRWAGVHAVALGRAGKWRGK